MTSVKTSEDIYNIDKYTDIELYQLLDLNNPTDRELEARIFHLIEKYKTMDNESGYKLAQFFEDIYEHFFEVVDGTEPFDASSQQRLTKGIADLFPSQMVPPNASASNAVTQMDYSKDYINPILKQTITRVVSIDSQFRNNKKTTLATNFSFNLSDSLRDVVSLRMNSVSIPKTWYTVSNSYGANIFYIKGNSPGINDGLHDYKVSITPGNYTATELITELNTSIKAIKTANTDVSFGNTGITYFGPDSKATIETCITSVYNETDYYLNFNYFTYPNDANINGVYRSIPSILGFEYQNNDIGTVLSNDLSGTGHASDNNLTYIGYADNSDKFYLTNSNNYFTVINYDGGYFNGKWNKYGDASFNDLSYNTFKIVSSLQTDASYTRLELVSDFSAQMQNSNYLLSNHCGIQRVYVDDANNNSYGYSRFKFQLYLNKKTTTNAVNQKTIMVVPNESKIWVGPTSCFRLDMSVNETFTLKATTKYKTSDYVVGNNVYFMAECDASGYFRKTLSVRDFSKNDVYVPIKTGTYILADYISELNKAIRRADISNNHIFDPSYNSALQNTNITGFYINATSDYNLRMRFFMNKSFNIDAYVIDVSTNNYFNVFLTFNNYIDYDISKNTRGTCDLSGSSSASLGNNYVIPNGTVLFSLKPNTTRPGVTFGNRYADPYVVRYTGPSLNNLNAETVKNTLNTIIRNFYDPILKLYPLKTASIRYTTRTDNIFTYITWYITLNQVSTKLSTTNYSIRFVDNNIANTWSSILYLDASYSLSRFPEVYSKTFDVSYVDILGTTKIYKNLLTVEKNFNDKITLKAGSDGVIDATGGGANDWTITIPPDTYSINKLITTLNTLFNASPKWIGSQIYTKNDYVYFKINTSKVYNTSDYRLVFYDPYSFVKCFVGASSVRNTTWDTTVGWMLGFRELTEYILSPAYLITDVNSPSDTYYKDTTSKYTYNTTTNVATIKGDTAVSVDLYKSFMISLDDYTQNHLNDGLVTIGPSENITTPASYVNKATVQCYPLTKNKVFTGTSENNNKNTETQIYAANQILDSRLPKSKKYSSAPFSKDIFAMIPLNISKVATGETIVDNGSGLAKHNRLYFGPVNISRMTIKLLNDRGDVVDLNGADWSCSIECEQLYQQKSL